MLRCIESIRYENNKIPLIKWHQDRFEHTQRSLWNKIIYPDLNIIIASSAKTFLFEKNKKYKCRVVYDEIAVDISFEKYQKKEIQKLFIRKNDTIEYHYKWEDRSAIDTLKSDIDKNADIIIVKNNFLADASFCNVALYDGDKWFTPKTPLLMGVQRARLLYNKIIFAKDISVEDLRNFEKIKLFNALTDWNESWELEIDKIY